MSASIDPRNAAETFAKEGTLINLIEAADDTSPHLSFKLMTSHHTLWHLLEPTCTQKEVLPSSNNTAFPPILPEWNISQIFTGATNSPVHPTEIPLPFSSPSSETPSTRTASALSQASRISQSSGLNATAEPFIRHINVTRTIDPPSFFPAVSRMDGDSQIPHDLPGSYDTKQALSSMRPNSPASQEPWWRREQLSHQPLSYQVAESWATSLENSAPSNGCLSGDPSSAPAPHAPGYVYDGNLLVANLPHRNSHSPLSSERMPTTTPSFKAASCSVGIITLPAPLAAVCGTPSSGSHSLIENTANPQQLHAPFDTEPAESRTQTLSSRPSTSPTSGRKVNDKDNSGGHLSPSDVVLDGLIRQMSQVSLHMEPLPDKAHMADDKSESGQKVGNTLHITLKSPLKPPPSSSHADSELRTVPASQLELPKDVMIGLIHDWDENSDRLRDASAALMTVLGETTSRLKASLKSTSTRTISNADAVSQIETAALRSVVDRLQDQLSATHKDKDAAANEVKRLEQEIQRLKFKWAAQEVQRSEWGRQKAIFSQKYLELERLYEDQEGRLQRLQARDGTEYGVVILEGEARMFDHEMIKKGYEGGRSVAASIFDRVAEIRDLAGLEKVESLHLILFIDVPGVMNTLIQRGIISNRKQYNEFLEGLNEQTILNCVIDVEAGDPTSKKVKGQLEHHLLSPACAFVMLASNSHVYKPLVESFRKRNEAAFKKFYVVKTRSARDDWSLLIGPERVLPVTMLYSLNEAQWEYLAVQGNIGQSNHYLPRGSLAVSERALSPASTTRDQPSIASSPPPMIRPTPWRTVQTDLLRAQVHSDIQFLGSDLPQYERTEPKPARNALAGGRLLDQYYATRPQRTSASPWQGCATLSDSSHTTRPKGTSSLAGSYSTPSCGLITAITVPFNPDLEGSITGSPPSSDEDAPSVTLPHSAQKFVQRPVKVTEGDKDDAVSSWSGASSKSTAIPFAPPDTSQGFIRNRDLPAHRAGSQAYTDSSPSVFSRRTAMRANPDVTPLGGKRAYN